MNRGLFGISMALSILGGIFLGISCQQNKSGPTGSHHDKSELPDSLFTYSGYFRAGNEVSVFMDCLDTTAFHWLVDESGVLSQQYETATGGTEYLPVTITIKAIKNPPLQIGYAEEYDGLITVREVLKMEQADHNDPCYIRFVQADKKPDAGD